jgi:SAM-dependent methyltransferase
MAHQEQIDFCLNVKSLFPKMFIGKKVLDVGSLDINGNNRIYFADCDYTGIDLAEGKNVDVVCSGHQYRKGEKEIFDVIISTECLEHDVHYVETLQNMFKLLKKGGLMIITCATTGRPEHGTKMTSPADSPFTTDYYHNVSEDDFRSALNDDGFALYNLSTRNTFPQDLYFCGVKKLK